ncbi:MAG: sulfopyruvate decarboxylase subunit beta [Candidatus Scalindua sp. AMX11]|nr:MAG: sulfopyruvate decarboxylase subunit beta [Candidatus Scalindua sp.]NOG85835.1 sulfopyruvate decarboxylase subunit beta [Planctomycetota bacterium]RZV96992.1 MAG: sulfopyruvate decarboxylase subunit beta [Candidatus Scalindua sp. SCAELEC01]TDE66396.1 MAG: sulfopyruvate decarboxylase subunit beta [Candidatus Scalindua sp. AMX11]GJQ58213.1 MAG: sulfopyruvate decarboxylase subunit beta [Candidatus Scalindua sp.]
MNCREAVKTVTAILQDQLVVCANGIISRETFTARDRVENFYMIGSMGLASSIGLGVALSENVRKVIVFDGDGNVLMNLGSLAMVGALQPKNFLHIVFDNEAYASTGNQPTCSNMIALENIAKSSGYLYAKRVTDKKGLIKEMSQLLESDGPSLLLVKISRYVGEIDIGRVTHTPNQIKERFMSAIK